MKKQNKVALRASASHPSSDRLRGSLRSGDTREASTNQVATTALNVRLNEIVFPKGATQRRCYLDASSQSRAADTYLTGPHHQC